MWEKYINAASIDDVLPVLKRYKNKARIIAGGTDLMLEMENGIKTGIDVLVDISRIPCSNLITLDEDGIIHLGFNVTHNDCVGSKIIREHGLPLALACWQVGSPQIRNRGTVIGNLITASPANDTISALMALEASVILKSEDKERIVPLRDFYLGVRKTVMQDDEMMVEVRFPALSPDEKGIYTKYALRNAQAISLVNVSIVLKMNGETIQDACITLGAVAPTIIHSESAENYLQGKKLEDATIVQAAKLSASDANPISDIRASAAYRKKMVEVITRRSLQAIRDGSNLTIMPAKPVLLRKYTQNHVPVIHETTIHGIHDPIKLIVNDQEVQYAPQHNKSLLRLLREDGLLTGTKEGCAEGECGACTVIMDDIAVMSCMVPAQRAHGTKVITVEGLANKEQLHPIQEAFIETGAVQCGYCTPGFLISAAMLMEEKESPDGEDVKQAITGNLCRCTGYYSILQAIERASIRK
jgi:carbon-monoxide dehydrogenase medium subunit